MKTLPDLKALRPERYVTRAMLWSGEPLIGFAAGEDADLDWLERMILEHGYKHGRDADRARVAERALATNSA